MDMVVMDPNFTKIFVLDSYESIIWVDRYFECGSFELYTPVTSDILTYVTPGNYIQNRDSNHVMIVEDISIESNVENGNHIKIIGRSLESILDRRIVWTQTKFSNANLQTAVKKLLTDAFINPSIAARKVGNFVFEDSTDSRITSLKLNKQYTGDNLLEVIEEICNTNKVGYKIILNDDNQFVFSLYMGTDRSYAQNDVPYVVFRPSFDNIIDSNYVVKNSEFKNVTLVAGEGEGTNRVTRTVGSGTGINRKELYTDARDIQKESNMTTAAYRQLLDRRGIEKLKECGEKKEFDGQCETTQLYVYGRDFVLGDTVQIANEYGIESSATITEFTWNYSNSGNQTYPTFTAVDDSIIEVEEVE